jgi:CRISPR-associated protein Cas2
MADRRMLTVFAYDVAGDRARARIADLLEKRLVRVQKSVFEGRLASAEAERLGAAAARHLGPGDSLRVYCVGAAGEARSRAYGPLPLSAAQDYWLL